MSSFGIIFGEGDGHSTEFAGLHPRQQATLEAARSVLRGISCEPLHTLGLDTAWDVAPYAFAAWDKTGEKAQALGYMPKAVSMGERVELYEVPSPIMVTVASSTSRAAALVVVVFTATNEMGYGDWGTADAFVEGIYDDLDEAEERFVTIQKALAALRSWSRGSATGGPKGPKGASF